MRDLDCLRCGTPMTFVRREKIQLGETGWILGDLSNLLAGSLDAEIWVCPICGKLEFFRVNVHEDDPPLPQKTCPRCGKAHDFDDPRCPFCKYDYYAR